MKIGNLVRETIQLLLDLDPEPWNHKDNTLWIDPAGKH